MAGPITGQRGAFPQPGSWGRNEQGNFTVWNYHGTKLEIYALASLFAQTPGLVYEVEENFGTWHLSVRFPWSMNGIDPRTDKIETWEMFSQHVEKDLLETSVENPGTVAKLTVQQVQKIRAYILDPPDGTTTPFPAKADFKLDGSDDGSNANAIYGLMQQGVRNFPVEAPVLRRTVITSNQYAVPASLVNVRKILSPGSLSQLEAVPNTLLFSLPIDTTSVTTLAYGWYKMFPTVQQVALMKWSITQEFQYGLWATLLWGQPI